ncbi:catalase family protein [Terriglobus sp.]|uniref:catalase family protein n=1 Tax=Terriglobus sp. TaxID=1889013 RepID=UPI003B00B89D
MPNHLLYSPAVEQPEPDEQETFQKIVKLMTEGQDLTREKYGRPIRISHAKAHAILKGTLVVRQDLPTQLAQGLFSKPGSYDVLVRMASAPGELLDDSKVNSTRGMAIKVFGVEGPKLSGHTADTQDFVLSPGKEFISGNAKAFLQAFKPNAEVAPKLSDTTKGIVSTISRVTNEALNAVGVNSAKLDFFGHPLVHPLGEAQYSQTAFRHGEFVAKYGVIPDTPALEALIADKFDPETPDALREDCNAFLKVNAAEYSFRVQLNTNTDEMSIEDATSPWPEELSQYEEVARLIIPAQTAWDSARDSFVEPLSFSPDHSLVAHQPLGSINRARRVAYQALSQVRRSESGNSTTEPANANALAAN